MTETDQLIAEFNKERNAAFLSLDENKIREHHKKWSGDELPTDMNVFWGAVHKAITGVRSLPIEFRKKSKQYLDDAGLKSLDDGDL